MRRHRQKTSAKKTGPKRVSLGNIPAEIEQAKLVELLAEGYSGRKPAVDVLSQNDGGRYGSADVNDELNDLDPDHRFHTSVEGENDHHDPQQHDRADNDRRSVRSRIERGVNRGQNDRR